MRRLASRVVVRTDHALDESEAVLEVPNGHDPAVIRVTAAHGSPQHPMNEDDLQRKVHSLSGSRLDGLLDDQEVPAASLLAVLTER